MLRDLYRTILKMTLFVSVIVSCCETFYFLGKLPKNNIKYESKYNRLHNNKYRDYVENDTTKIRYYDY